MMAAALEEGGHTVVQAKSARQALQLHQEQASDLIVTDLVMKEMDGTELIRRVRATSPGTPVIGISGNKHSTIYLNMAKLIGAHRVVEKPCSPAHFVRIVNDVLAAGA